MLPGKAIYNQHPHRRPLHPPLPYPHLSPTRQPSFSYTRPFSTPVFSSLCLPVLCPRAAVVSCWLLPWLVFHTWMGTLSLLRHTAPHIPFRAANDGYDWGRATICGTVTVRLPRWLETLLNNANYTLPQVRNC